ncbi:MAG: hypothetical protein HXY41_00420 [Chloroflexi bacterium]|nr:hypothetical protein [Chloroflexota bacterium]
MRKSGVLLIVTVILVLMAVAACQVVPGTGDSSSDAAAAQKFLPNLSGYAATEASNIQDALTKVGAGASVLSGNLPLAAAIAKLDDTLRCYQNVGAVAVRVYTEQDIVRAVTAASVPKIGVVGVVNTTRLQRNLFSCVLNTGGGAQAQAQGATIEPCGGSGSFTANGENLQYVYAATAPDLCSAIQGSFPRQ